MSTLITPRTTTYTLLLQTSASSGLANATTYYFGLLLAGTAITTTANIRGCSVPFTGTITQVSCCTRIVTSAGSTEAATLSIVVYNSAGSVVSTTQVSNAIRFDASGNLGTGKSVSFTGLNIAVTAGQHIEAKLLTPTYTGTIPSGFNMDCNVLIVG